MLAGVLLAQGAGNAAAAPTPTGAPTTVGAPTLAPGSPAARFVERLVRRLPAVRPVRVPLGDAATSQAQHVTDSGWVAGRAVYSPGPEGSASERVFRWRHGSVAGQLFPHDGDILQVHDLGERGDVAVTRGWWRQGRMEAAVWRPDGSVEAITPPGVRSRAAAVNRRGDVVGTFVVPGEGWHAFLWRDGVLQDLGTLGDEGEVLDVNDRGDVLARRTETTGAMLWRDGTWTELPGHAYDLDERGNVLGVRGTRGPSSGGTVVWQPDGRERDLGLPGLSAGALAENGVVAGVLPPDDAVTW